MPKRSRTLGFSTAAILQAIDAGRRYGLDIMDATSLASGAVYPALGRLERRGFVRGTWEADRVARQEARPRRRYYEITREGRVALVQALERFATLGRVMEGREA
ncbi:MAG: helix-turn-helix transcriptional regulator [Gemmatimonadetes bacterium]|nr:helix-turn-helix transcriptional regulator [Gemmatimonadota bacterium]